MIFKWEEIGAFTPPKWIHLPPLPSPPSLGTFYRSQFERERVWLIFFYPMYYYSFPLALFLFPFLSTVDNERYDRKKWRYEKAIDALNSQIRVAILLLRENPLSLFFLFFCIIKYLSDPTHRSSATFRPRSNDLSLLLLCNYAFLNVST